jgi:hypothetical protein
MRYTHTHLQPQRHNNTAHSRHCQHPKLHILTQQLPPQPRIPIEVVPPEPNNNTQYHVFPHTHPSVTLHGLRCAAESEARARWGGREARERGRGSGRKERRFDPCGCCELGGCCALGTISGCCYVCTCERVRACAYICCSYIQSCMHACMHACMQYTHTFSPMRYKRMYALSTMFTYVCTYVYTHTHTTFFVLHQLISRQHCTEKEFV